MTKPSALNKKGIAVYMLGAQFIAASLFPLLVWFAVGKDAALATGAGGWIAALANLYFAIQAFRFSGARASQRMVRAFYRGEAGKFAMVMLLFLAVFELLPTVRENAGFLFSAFLLVYGIAWWVAALNERMIQLFTVHEK